MTLEEYLQLQLQLQEKIGVNPLLLDHAQRVQYIKDTILALTDELHEALNEVTWKPWAKAEPKVHEDHFFREVIDAFHFLMNLMLVAYQEPPEQIARRVAAVYTYKRDVNVKRQENGYDAQSTKCPSCKRALEDVTLHEIRKLDGGLDFVLCECNYRLPLEVVRPFLVD